MSQLDRIIEQLSHPFMVIIIILMGVIAVCSVLAFIIDKPLHACRRPQDAMIGDLVRFEGVVKKSSSVELQELLEALRANLDGISLGRREIVRTMMMIDFVEHTLHTRK